MSPVMHFNRVHIFGEWDGHPMFARPRLFFAKTNDRFLDLEKELHTQAFRRIRKKLGFTDREWQILDLRARGANCRETAARLKCSPYTVRTHDRHILEHARQYLSARFYNISEVAAYLSEMYLTNIKTGK